MALPWALLLWVAAGSALGGLARFAISGLVARTVGETFPWGTMTVNVTGCFLIGICASLADGSAFFSHADKWPLLVTGVLGSYTTVSSFSLQTLALARDGEWPRVVGNVVLSLCLCLAAVVAGMATARHLGVG